MKYYLKTKYDKKHHISNYKNSLDKTMRKNTKYIKERDNVYPRYNEYNEIKKTSYYHRIRYNKKWGFYQNHIVDRVFDHNMIYGLTEGNYRNFYTQLKLVRKYRK
jgi:hypothetical protein